MDPLAQIEFNATQYTMKDDYPGFGAPALERDKKTVFWMSGVMECFSTVWSLFKSTDYEETQGKFMYIHYINILRAHSIRCNYRDAFKVDAPRSFVQREGGK